VLENKIENVNSEELRHHFEANDCKDRSRSPKPIIIPQEMADVAVVSPPPSGVVVPAPKKKGLGKGAIITISIASILLGLLLIYLIWAAVEAVKFGEMTQAIDIFAAPDSNISLGEVEVLGQSGNLTNYSLVATNAKADQSTTAAGHDASLAIDNNLSTYSETAGPGESGTTRWSLNFTNPVAANLIRIYAAPNGSSLAGAKLVIYGSGNNISHSSTLTAAPEQSFVRQGLIFYLGGTA